MLVNSSDSMYAFMFYNQYSKNGNENHLDRLFFLGGFWFKPFCKKEY